jgi:UDP-N-acetylmuramate dehydrogenase
VTYRLTPGGTPSLKYADLQKHFAASDATPSLADVREAVRGVRQSKGMLIVPGDPDCRSAGSFFKNPVLSETQFHDLASRAASRGLKIPSYPALDAQRKVSAAWLVEHSGFAKGFTLGAAGISQKHALALINTGNACASDIVRIKEKVQRGVEEAWGLVLETEPVFVGF